MGGRLRWGRSRDQLVVIGGAESREPGNELILTRFVELAGGAKARIGVLATASGDTGHLEEQYVQTFLRLGVPHVDALHVRTRAEANDDLLVSAAGKCTAVFFTDGDQLRLATVIGGSRLDSALHARAEAGDLVVAGTGAGAAMLASSMIIGADGRLSTVAGRTGPGLEFLPGVLIDMHFAARGRLNRLLSAIALYPHELGLGIDADTAIVVSGGRFEVIGAGAVTVVDAGEAAMIRTPTTGDGAIALSGVRLHVLPAGYAFELTSRQPVVVESPADVQDAGAFV